MSGTGQELMQKLHKNTSHFRERMTEAGFVLKVSVNMEFIYFALWARS